MIRYTLRAMFVKLVGHPGYAPGVSRSQAERISIFLVPVNVGQACSLPAHRLQVCATLNWRSRRVLPPLSLA